MEDFRKCNEMRKNQIFFLAQLMTSSAVGPDLWPDIEQLVSAAAGPHVTVLT